MGQDELDMIAYLRSQGWEVMQGWSGQWRYNGPVMHPSEYIGDRMAEYIMEAPGMYVSLPVDIQGPYEGSETEFFGWIVAYQY